MLITWHKKQGSVCGGVQGCKRNKDKERNSLKVKWWQLKCTYEYYNIEWRIQYMIDIQRWVVTSYIHPVTLHYQYEVLQLLCTTSGNLTYCEYRCDALVVRSQKLKKTNCRRPARQAWETKTTHRYDSKGRLCISIWATPPTSSSKIEVETCLLYKTHL